jgi:hypothetical protein
MNRPTTLFVIADIIAVFAFVIIGKSSHAETLRFSEIIAVAWPFLLGLFVCGWWLGAQRPQTHVTPLKLIGITLAHWMLAVPFGLVLRELIYNKPIVASFAITTFIFGALLLIAGRLTIFFIQRKTSSKTQ